MIKVVSCVVFNLENIIDDIRVTPQYIALYNEYHEALSNIGYIDNNEINSFYTHFTGLGGGSYIVSKKLHWRGKFTDLCFVIFMLYPDQCYDAIRYEPIKEHIEYQHKGKTCKNGTNFASAATRPLVKFKRIIRNLYIKESDKPIKAQKI